MSTHRVRSGAVWLLAAILLGLAIANAPTDTTDPTDTPPDPAAAVDITRGPGADLAADPTPRSATTTPDRTAPDAARARELLASLPIRVEDTGAHYDRDQWGDWSTSASGCDTRETVLIRDGRDVQTGAGCRVLAGTWDSTYDDTTITDPRRVQIDHRVPLAEAQRSGARDWTPDQRAAFYNDTANLIAVSARSNTSKGDDDPGRWRPSQRSTWCGYAAAYIATKHAYRLHVDPDEHAALSAMLRACPGGGGAR